MIPIKLPKDKAASTAARAFLAEAINTGAPVEAAASSALVPFVVVIIAPSYLLTQAFATSKGELPRSKP
jgi:fatty acid desaturase